MTSEELHAIFFVECEESLAAAETGLAACAEGTQDADTVNAIFRAVHSVKGGAGAFGFSALQAYTHCFETLLSDVREGLVPITTPLVQLLLRALDTLSDHVRSAREGSAAPDDSELMAEMTAAMAANQGAEPVSDAASAEIASPQADDGADHAADDDDDIFGDFDLDSLLDDIAGEIAPDGDLPAEEPVSAEDTTPSWPLHLRPHAAAMQNGSEPLLLLREVAELGGICIDCDISAIPPLDELDPRQGYLGWTFAIPASVDEDAVRDIFDFVGDDCGVAIGVASAMPDPRLEQRTAAAPAPIATTTLAPAPKPAPAAVAVATAEAAPIAAEPATPSADNDHVTAAPAAAAPPAAPVPGPSIRIDLVKLDRLIDAVGELVIAQAMLAQRLSSEGRGAAEELALLEGLTRDIQESAMAIRAQPIASVFSRVPRILRELTASTGKHVKLEVSGETTELDKTVIERLGEPLTHLIRNAVDHGIESAEERLAKGKSAEGTLCLSAEHRSGRILVRIADDGAGINQARVLAKAVEKGLVSADAQLSKEEIDNLIFAPGFSTAQVVSNISGRGVGMDVVRQNVKELGGRITIESEEGKGTAFILTLPLTLAISDGMIVNAGDQTLVVPLAHVVESLRPDPKDVQGLGADRRMLNVRGKFIPVLAVSDIVGAKGGVTRPEEGVLIVVDTEAAGQAALLVDNINDQRQFVIKSLDTHYRAVQGVAGATILGDGRVALILDVDGLVSDALEPVQMREAA